MKYGSMSINEYIDRLSSNDPMPGGGVANALLAAQGVSLILMVLNLSMIKVKFKCYENELKIIKKQYEKLKFEFISLMDEDEIAFNNMIDIYKMKKESDEEKRLRNEKMQKVLIICIKPPLELLDKCNIAISLSENLSEKITKSAISDVKIGLNFLKSASESSLENIMINAKLMENEKEKEKFINIANEHIKNINIIYNNIIMKL